MKTAFLAKLCLLALSCLTGALSIGTAAGTARSVGANLLEGSGARDAALGGAFAAASDDTAAFSYNPASLASLISGQALFVYHKGIADDSSGRFGLGIPAKNKAFGLYFGYYDGGSFNLNEGGAPVRKVRAQTDLLLSAGYAHRLQKLSVGFSGKYLSSELGELRTARAFAADLGVAYNLSPRVRLAAAAQNFGSKLKFINEGDDLPRSLRSGLAFLLIPAKYKTAFFTDLVYRLIEQEVRPAFGLETSLGPVQLRAGYRPEDSLQTASFGAGFNLNGISVDYSFGVVQKLDSRHRVSFSWRFRSGGAESVLAPALSIASNAQTHQTEEIGPKPVLHIPADKGDRN